MDAKTFIRAVLLVLCLVLAAPAVIWLVTTTDLQVVAIAGMGLLVIVLLAYMAYVYRWRFWAWFMGGLAVLLTPGLLKLGAQFISGDFKAAMEAWIYVYAAGAVGGLVLELIRAKGGLEFPSAEPPAGAHLGPALLPNVAMPGTNGGDPSGAALATPPPSTAPYAGAPAAGPALMTAPSTTLAVAPASAPFVAEPPSHNGAELAEPAAVPRGGRTYIGFFARITMGGVAAAAVLILVRIIVGDTLPSDFLASALRLDTLAGAVLVGMIAPAVWTAWQNVFESKSSFMKGVIDTAAVAVASAERSVSSAQELISLGGGAESSQFIVDAAPLRSPEFIATLAREDDPTEVGKMLLARINGARIDVGATHTQQEAQLEQALGSLETAERILRSAGQRAARR